MRKIKYIALLVVATSALFFAGCLKNGDQVTGPQGATGATGAPGGQFLALSAPASLSLSTLQAGPVPNTWVYKWSFSGADNPAKITYFLEVYASKVNLKGRNVVWNKLPYPNVWGGGDLLSAYMQGDTVTITYSSSSGWPAQGDSTINCTIYAIPMPQP